MIGYINYNGLYGFEKRMMCSHRKTLQTVEWKKVVTEKIKKQALLPTFISSTGNQEPIIALDIPEFQKYIIKAVYIHIENPDSALYYNFGEY